MVSTVGLSKTSLNVLFFLNQSYKDFFLVFEKSVESRIEYTSSISLEGFSFFILSKK